MHERLTSSPSTTAGSIADKLRGAAPIVLPSLLQCDFGHLADEVKRVTDGGAHALHLDCMDGHFVPNMTYGLTIVEAVRKLTDVPLDVHLMIANPQQYIRHYRDAGADIITIHAEAVADPGPLLQEIRQTGALAGLAINPPTPIEGIRPSLGMCDLVLVMSVMPGFGGQKFNPVALEKLSWLREACPAGILLEVDGGVNPNTIAQCNAAGADLFVVGSAIFSHEDYGTPIAELAMLASQSKR
jgi:ribulose-phosphate 3-epimerase